MSNLAYKFGKNLYKLRKVNKLTQQELAEKIEVSSDFIGLMERGINNPSFKTLEKLSEALEIPIYKLFQFSEDE